MFSCVYVSVFLLMCAIVYVSCSHSVAALLAPGLHLCAVPGPGVCGWWNIPPGGSCALKFHQLWKLKHHPVVLTVTVRANGGCAQRRSLHLLCTSCRVQCRTDMYMSAVISLTPEASLAPSGVFILLLYVLQWQCQ